MNKIIKNLGFKEDGQLPQSLEIEDSNEFQKVFLDLSNLTYDESTGIILDEDSVVVTEDENIAVFKDSKENLYYKLIGDFNGDIYKLEVGSI